MFPKGVKVIHSPPQVVGRTFVIAFGIGITFGFSFAYLLLSSTNGTVSVTGLLKYSHHGHHHDQHSDDEFGDDHAGPSQDVNLHADHVHSDDDTEARKLQQNVRVLCWVMTGPENHKKKAVHVKKTWGKRCNQLLFMSSLEEPDLPSIKLPVGEGRDNLWGKTKEAFKYVYENHLDDFDWFMKADDDTYVVVENLRYMLSLYNASQPIFFGHKFKPYVKQGYMSGGAGYVLSREALRRFIVEAIGSGDGKTCRTDAGGAEDVEIGKCLQNVGVRAGDSRDEYGRDRFLPFVPEHHLIPGHVGHDFWWWQYIYYPSAEGFNCCADTAISFHYVSPNEMYVLDYLIYHLKPHGIIPERSEGPPPTPPDYDGKATPWVGFKN